MKPAPFDYYAPASVDEALDVLDSLGYGVKVLAGGQSLVPSMNFRLAVPPALLDLNNIADLSYIRPEPDGGIAIGAMTRDSEVEHSPVVAERFPLIVESMPHIAHPQIRNRGTFGGAIAHADPTAQLPAICLALKARYLARSKKGERWIETDEFFVGPFTSTLEPEELLVEISIPPMGPRSGSSYQQMARQAGAQALVGIATVVDLDEKGQVEDARIALFSVGETPLLAAAAAQKLIGQVPTEEIIQEAAVTAATEDVDPGGDIHCSPEFRRHLVEVLVVKSLNTALERARQKGG